MKGINLILQFRLPDKLSTLMQRLGRGGRDLVSACQCIVFVEEIYFEKIQEEKALKAATAKEKRAEKAKGRLKRAHTSVDDARDPEDPPNNRQRTERSDEGGVDVEMADGTNGSGSAAVSPSLPPLAPTAPVVKAKSRSTAAKSKNQQVQKELMDLVNAGYNGRPNCRRKIFDMFYENWKIGAWNCSYVVAEKCV